MRKLIVDPKPNLEGSVFIPGDKSISHRALMFASIALGESRIKNLLEGHDCLATLGIMRELGVHIELDHDTWVVKGKGHKGLIEPENILDCKNSGTTIRLMCGLLSAMDFFSLLDGSDQIKTRPMGRVIDPLKKMGAQIFSRSKNTLAPIAICPAKLLGSEQTLQVKSAQVKSALVIASLFADQKSIFKKTAHTRDHTEIMLKHMGASIFSEEDRVEVSPLTKELKPLDLIVPGDISSAAFLIAAGIFCAKEFITLKGVGINKTRTGLIDALERMGAKIQFVNERTNCGEPVCDLQIYKSTLKGQEFSGDMIVRMIDEIPTLALIATQAQGTTVIRDASELKVKESNRIEKTVCELKKLGANIEESEDGMIIHGPTPLKGANVESYGDHRLALMLSVAGLVAQESVEINNAQVIDDSFPGFEKLLQSLGANVREKSS